LEEAVLRTQLAEYQPEGHKPTASIGQQDRRQTIADRMEALAIELRSFSDDQLSVIPTQATLAGLAAKIYSARRKVDEIFDMTGFAVSPAWDMMLDLYQAKVTGKKISVTSACIGGGCPTTTGLRWLQVIENMMLIERKPDPEDKRRTVIQMTDGGKVKVERALTAFL
jgi:hypothetical protein